MRTERRSRASLAPRRVSLSQGGTSNPLAPLPAGPMAWRTRELAAAPKAEEAWPQQTDDQPDDGEDHLRLDLRELVDVTFAYHGIIDFAWFSVVIGMAFFCCEYWFCRMCISSAHR